MKTNDVPEAYCRIITPDGAGSKGDEAMISGCFNLLQGEKALLITPNPNQWSDVLVGRTHLFEERVVPLQALPEQVMEPCRLIVIGADTLDGSCGYEAAHWRLEAIRTAAEHGAQVVVHGSIRSDMDERLIGEWKALPAEGISIFLRDAVSEENFVKLVSRPVCRFPDLAFFALPIQTARVREFCEKVKASCAPKRLIGLEISETLFRSFNTEITDENRREFAGKFASLALQGLSPEDTGVLLFTHDTREWDAHWSDYQYATAAYERLSGVNGFTCFVQPKEFTQAELLNVLPMCDLLICGRMHMSITACCAGVVPLIVAGVGKNYVMVDKVRGMCKEWFDTDENLALMLEHIPALREQLLNDGFREKLQNKLELQQRTLPTEKAKMAELLGVQPVQWEEADALETALIQALQRSGELNRAYLSEQTLCRNQEAHIEMLLQSERELLGENQTLRRTVEQSKTELQRQYQAYRQQAREKQELAVRHQELTVRHQELTVRHQELTVRLQEIECELLCAKGEVQQLRDKENRYLNDIAAIRASRSWRFAQFFARILRFFIPIGSKRALLARILWTMVRHPGVFFRNLTPRKIKKTLRMLRRGDTEGVQLLVQGKVTGEPAPSTIIMDPPEIVAVETCEKTIDDYPVLQIPQWDEPTVSIIIPVYNQFEFTYHCVESILNHSGDVTYEILIANDCSSDLTTEIDRILPGVKCVTNEKNLRFLRNCNNAAKYAVGKYVLFLNNDTQVMENWLQPLVTLIESADDIGLVGSKLIYPDGRLQEAGGILWKDGSAWNYGNRQNPAMPQFNYVKQVDYISGAAIMLSRVLWEEIGGFDEHFAPAYCEDSDLCFTVRKMGYRVMYQPLSVVVHFEGVSNGTDTASGQKKYQIENSEKFRIKWAEELEKHPENGENVFQARDYSFGKKTLLMVDHYVPHFDKDAGSRTVFQYLRLFVDQGFNVKFIGDNFYQHEPYTTVLQQMGIEVLYGPEYANHWRDWVRENAEHIDYVFLNRPHIAPKYLDFLRVYTGAKIMYYGHDLAFLREMREYEITGDASFLDSSKEWQPKELELMRSADMAYYPSCVEVDEIHKIDPTIAVKAIPAYLFENVVWEGYNFEARKDIMFIGGFGHRPNVDAVRWLASDVLPLLKQEIPDIRIHILGSNPPKEVLDLANENLIMEGFVTDEQLDAFYRTTRISLVPLRYGAGIKGKVVEAMRYGTPVVTTPTGAEGIPNAESIMAVEETAEALAARLAALYRDSETLTEMSRRSVAYVQENYSHRNALAVIGPEFGLTE